MRMNMHSEHQYTVTAMKQRFTVDSTKHFSAALNHSCSLNCNNSLQQYEISLNISAWRLWGAEENSLHPVAVLLYFHPSRASTSLFWVGRWDCLIYCLVFIWWWRGGTHWNLRDEHSWRYWGTKRSQLIFISVVGVQPKAVTQTVDSYTVHLVLIWLIILKSKTMSGLCHVLPDS